MGLVVLAQVVRELITDGEYVVEYIEHRDRGKVAVAFALRARAQPYNIQIETTDHKLGGLFRALLDEGPTRAGQSALVKVGHQPVPVVEVDSLPADVAKGRRPRKQRRKAADGLTSDKPVQPPTRSRNSTQQLALVPQEPTQEPAVEPRPSKRRRTARGGSLDETP